MSATTEQYGVTGNVCDEARDDQQSAKRSEITAPMLQYPADLPRRMQALEEAAFAEFGEMFGPRFAGYFRRNGMSQSDAEELSVDCVTKASCSIRKFEDRFDGAFGGWVWRLAKNAHVDWLRRQRPTVPLDDEYSWASQTVAPDTADPDTADPDIVDAVHAALGRLTPKDQQIIKLRALGPPLDYVGVAAQLGIQPGAARLRYLRAKKRLQAFLEEDHRIVAWLALGQRRAVGDHA